MNRLANPWLLNLVFGLAYYLSAKLAAVLTVPQTNVGLVYIPVGLSMAACMYYGYRIWPAIVLGSFPAILPFLLDNYTLPQALLISGVQVLADVIQVILGTWLYYRFGGNQNPLQTVADVVRFLVYPAFLAQAAGATLGVAALMFGGQIDLALSPAIWMSWWISNVVSVLCITPFMLLRMFPSPRTPSRRGYVLHGLFYLATTFIASLIFFYRTSQGHHFFEYPAVIIVIGAAFTLSQRGTTTSTLLIAVIALLSTALGAGPFNAGSTTESLLLLESFLILLSGTGLVMSGVLSEREHAKEEVIRGAELFRTAFENTNAGVCLVDIDGQFRRANRTLCDLLGYTQEELLTKCFDDITFDEDRAVGHSHMQQMVNGVKSSASFEKRYVTRSGRILWASVSTVLVRGPYGQPEHFVTYIQDITERIRAEKLLRESEDRYHQLFELSPDPVAVHSAGRIVLANAAALRTFGAGGPEEIIGKPVMDFVDPQFHNVVQMRISKEIVGHQTVPTIEERFIRLDGRTIDVEVTAAPISHGGKPASLVVFRDIQERKKAESLQRALYEISRAANDADTLDELFAAVHRIIGSVMRASNFYIALRDFREEKIFFPYFVDEVDANPGPRQLRRGLTEYVLRTGRGLLCDEATDARLRQTGEIESIGAPSCIWLGVPLMVGKRTLGVLVVQDYRNPQAYGPRELEILEFISEQTAKSIERQEHVEQLRISLSEKGVMLKEIHHRVKNNMQVISSLLNLEAQHLAEGQAKGILMESMNRIRSMAIVHETLYQSGNMANIEFDEYLHSVTAGLVRSFYREGIACHVDAEKVYLDLDRAIPCGLIVNELVSNALKHAFPLGKTGNIVVSLRADAEGTVELAVQDDGVGFPDGKPFDQMTTMGLTLVNSLAHQILGSIALDRSNGTRFVLRFKRTT